MAKLFIDYLNEQTAKMERVISNCIRHFGPYKPDGSPRLIFPDDFAEGFTFETEKPMIYETLDEIAIRCGADKASRHPVKGHDYAAHYEDAFGFLQDEQIKILEVGVGGGESIRMWLEYFKNAHVYGCDIVSDTNPFNTHYPAGTSNPNPRYDFLQGDQGSKTHWACFLAFSGRDFTIVIDDGGHFSGQIITTFECLWPAVVPGGYYCIEDLAAGSTVGTVFLTPNYPSHMDFLKGLIEKMNLGENDIASIQLSPELAIIQKRA